MSWQARDQSIGLRGYASSQLDMPLGRGIPCHKSINSELHTRHGGACMAACALRPPPETCRSGSAAVVEEAARRQRGRLAWPGFADTAQQHLPGWLQSYKRGSSACSRQQSPISRAGPLQWTERHPAHRRQQQSRATVAEAAVSMEMTVPPLRGQRVYEGSDPSVFGKDMLYAWIGQVYGSSQQQAL